MVAANFVACFSTQALTAGQRNRDIAQYTTLLGPESLYADGVMIR